MKKYKVILDLLKEQKGRYFTGLFLIAISNPLTNIFISILFMDVFNKAVYDARLIPAIALKFLGLALVLALIIPFGSYFINYSAIRTTARLREESLKKLIKMDQTSLTESHSGDLISRATNDIQITETAYKEHLQQVTQILFNGIGCTVFMLIINWRFALGLIAYQTILFCVVTRFAKHLKKASDEVQTSLGKVTEKISDILAGSHVIRMFNIGGYMVEKFKEQNDNAKGKAERRVRINAAYQGVNTFAWTSSFIGFIIISSWFMSKGYIELGTIIALSQLQNGVTQLFSSLGSYINQLQTSLAGFDRVVDLLNKQEEPKHYPLTEEGCYDSSALSLYNVNFQYEADVKVINNLNLNIKKGETIAIVGPSGGGKSTLFKLLLGFNFPQSGCISFMGKPASKYTIEEIRNLLAFVPQEPYLFSGSVLENIAYGLDNANQEQIIAAAKQANAHEFVENLDEGYNTMVGERGTFLSGGQKQRIAIARAIIKNAEILLLDEATSALDNESEALVQKALDELMEEKTSIVIAHRLSTIEKADRILVMEHGTIVEEGTHSELLAQHGVYSKLYNLQFKNDDVA